MLSLKFHVVAVVGIVLEVVVRTVPEEEVMIARTFVVSVVPSAGAGKRRADSDQTGTLLLEPAGTIQFRV